MKICTKCHQEKELSEFYKHKHYKNGHRSECKECTKKYAQTEQGRVVHREAGKKYYKTEKGKAIRRKAVKKYYQTEKGKECQKARQVVNNAIAAGRLPRPDTLPCHYCPKPAQQYHHYLGYAPEHWLDVVPACRSCDKKWHKEKICG